MTTLGSCVLGIALALSASTALAAPAWGQAPATVSALPESLEQSVDRVAHELIAKRQTAGFVIGVERSDGARLIKGYGFANLEHRTPVTGRTVFRVGSITKEFTAAAILLLAERGELSIDDSLAKYVPGFPRGDEVTLRHLLHHTSGIHNYTALDGFLKSEARLAFTGEEMAKYIAGAEPLYDFAPGEGWSYSNSGYLLLGLIIEKVSQQPLAQALQLLLFDPLGLDDTRLDDLGEIVPNRAQGYEKAPDSDVGFKNAAFIAMEAAAGAGAIRSTAADLLDWHRALLGGKVLKPESLELMIQPGRLKDGRLASIARAASPGQSSRSPSDYGFGISIGQQNGRRTIGHGGAINGFNASLSTYPDEQITIVVLTNTLPAAGAVTSAMIDPIFIAIGEASP